jgi:hypothetical protein
MPCSTLILLLRAILLTLLSLRAIIFIIIARRHYYGTLTLFIIITPAIITPCCFRFHISAITPLLLLRALLLCFSCHAPLSLHLHTLLLTLPCYC